MGLAKMTCAFGKAPAEHDDRNLKLADILVLADIKLGTLPLPAEYDFDHKHKKIPRRLRKYLNPPLENCVIAGRAHQTLRFELVEQKTIINIKNKDVRREFYNQTGGVNKNIKTLESLKLWRTRGWEAAGQNFKILAFAQLDLGDHEQIKRMIYINLGVGLGFCLPDSALTQFDRREPWYVTRDKADHGHYVYVPAYTKDGPVCVTWGRKQQMSWEFVDKYCDEAYVIIDAVDTQEKKQTLDEEKLKKFLASCAPVPA